MCEPLGFQRLFLRNKPKKKSLYMHDIITLCCIYVLLSISAELESLLIVQYE